MTGALKVKTSTDPDVWTVIGGGSFATEAETVAGVLDDRAVTPAGLNAALDEAIPAALPYVDVRSFGAVGDGVTDDTAAIDAAWAASHYLLFPEGDWVYNGSGLDPDGVTFGIRGIGRNGTTISLGASSYLVNSAAVVPACTVEGITIDGGLGGFRWTSTTAATAQVGKAFRDIYFLNYTAAAVSHLSTDCPNWRFEFCTFWAAQFDGSRGIALSGLCDNTVIDNCEFRRNEVSVKLDRGGNNAHIVHSQFIRFTGSRTRPAIDVWVVPYATSSTNSGQGFTVRDCKFGNENLLAGDLRIVYANEGAGTDFTDKVADLTTISTGHISGHTISGCALSGTGVIAPPLIFSTTPRLCGISVTDLVVQGSIQAYVVELLGPPVAANDYYTEQNVIGPIRSVFNNISNTPVTEACNYTGMFDVFDPNEFFESSPIEARLVGTAGEASGYVNLLSNHLSDYTNFATVGGVATNDVLGRASAGTMLLTTTGVNEVFTTAHTGRLPIWVEFDARQAAGTPLTYMTVQLRSSSTIMFQRSIKIAATWQHYRFCTTMLGGETFPSLQFRTISGTGNVEVGRARVYHAQEAVNRDGYMIDLAHRGTLAGFYSTTPIVKQTGVAVTAAGVHAALVNLGLIGA